MCKNYHVSESYLRKCLSQVAYVLVMKMVQSKEIMEDSRTGVVTLPVYTKPFQLNLSVLPL